MKEIRRNLYENEKNLFTPKIKEIEKNLELEKNLSNLKKYYDYIVGPLLLPPPPYYVPKIESLGGWVPNILLERGDNPEKGRLM